MIAYYRVWFTFGLMFAAFMVPANAQEALSFRYNMKKGDTLVYEIKMVATIGDVKETREGSSIYTVQSVTDQEITFSHEGNMNTRRVTRDGRPVITMPSFGSMWTDNLRANKGKVTMSTLGTRMEADAYTSLPYMMGDFQTHVFEELPGDNKTKWEKKREVSVIRKKANAFPPLPRGPFGNRTNENEETRSAHEKVNYEIVQSNKDVIKIRKQYHIATDDKVKGNPRREMTGEGELSFDPKIGAFRSQLLTYEIKLNDDNLTMIIPVTSSYRLLSEEEAVGKLKALEEARVKVAETVKKMNDPVQVSKGDLASLLVELKDSNKFKAKAAADKLAKAIPEGDKEEVCKALLEAMKTSDHFLKVSSVKALAVWGTPSAGPALLEALKDKDVFVRKGALEVLGGIKVKEAPAAVASLLIEHSSRADAAKTLKAMGPMAEEAVLAMINDRDGWVQREACQVLEVIGTKASLEPIKKYGESGKPFAKDTADKALKAIEQRK